MLAAEARAVAESENYRGIINYIHDHAMIGLFECKITNLKSQHIKYLTNLGYVVYEVDSDEAYLTTHIVKW